MKKFLVIFLLCFVAVIIYWIGNSIFNENVVVPKSEHFVSIKENKFMLNGKYFYPVILNYIVSLQADKNGIWACSYYGYNPESKHLYTTKDSCLLQLKNDMELIKEMGFNSVRLVGLGGDIEKTGELSLCAKRNNQRDTIIMLINNKNYQKYFVALSELFDVVNNAGLKVTFLISVVPEIESTEEHFIKLASYFKEDTTIMAYDFFNEPLYFDSLERSKKDVYYFTKHWKKAVQKYAPNHLYTIGLTGIREVMEWDPNILDVDFLSIHPYEYEPEQVRNEMYWYKKHIKKPWMIGETAIPADDDSVCYSEQTEFARKTLLQAYNCGAIGYSWWQYKDVQWSQFHPSFMGAVNRKNKTFTAKGGDVFGTQKPFLEEIKKFNSTAKKDSCLCLSNYYNYSQLKNFRLTGRLTDKNNNPIEGGVVLAWNQWWNKSYHTVSKADGSFELLGSFPFYHWMASATLYSMVRGDVLPDKAKKYSDTIPTLNIGGIKLKKLTFVE